MPIHMKMQPISINMNSCVLSVVNKVLYSNYIALAVAIDLLFCLSRFEQARSTLAQGDAEAAEKILRRRVVSHGSAQQTMRQTVPHAVRSLRLPSVPPAVAATR